MLLGYHTCTQERNDDVGKQRPAHRGKAAGFRTRKAARVPGEGLELFELLSGMLKSKYTV